MTLDEAYKAWLALGQNYELDRFANTRVAFTGGFAWAGALADEVRASLPAQAGEPARLREATQTLLARYDSLDAPDPVREIADAIESLRASLAFMAGEPIRRRDTPPYRKEPAAGLIDFAAGYQVAAALPVEALAPSDERQVFEQWAHSMGFNTHRDETDKYKDYHRATTRFAREGWLSALAWRSHAVTEEMVTAYLQANDAYWKRTDDLPKHPAKWRNGTPSEATRISLEAALAAAPSVPQGVTKQPAPDSYLASSALLEGEGEKP